ncbi:TetR/AcrR family transcriptional regulator [Clostridium folliculivorans]|uniref:TetR family transcriptional regulator n=1 Tax=Clostridium folliculivorans TaxID=2886038 RepID=A0A9W5Y5D7_9CLOT|nr:TetR/AcrR family transcriptional regulator [Clostridium folliculivorans]GKU26757.1 TetR family transcriptional regulator [Clostridium folliculivorans]GKU31351.1 TetR family transcriptional regulator [Clostridium folliculivorans]
MKRIVKDPLERKNEIMDRSLELFIEKGYDNTSINEIVNSLSIAKGTFYHYFTSKEEILGELLKRRLDEYIVPLITIYNSNLDPNPKLEAILKAMFLGTNSNLVFANTERDSSNLKLNNALEEEFFNRCYPLILGVIKEGIEKGSLEVDFPEEVVEILLRGIQKFINKHFHELLDKNSAIHILKSLEDIFNKLIKLSDGNIELIPRN